MTLGIIRRRPNSTTALEFVQASRGFLGKFCFVHDLEAELRLPQR